jgi:hypothetical protein
MKGFPKWVDDTHVLFGTSLYDVNAICDHYKVKMEDFCVCNLSTKPGNERFIFCPSWGSKGHESAKSSAHTVPNNFNMKHVNKKFMERQNKGKKGGKGKKRKHGDT